MEITLGIILGLALIGLLVAYLQNNKLKDTLARVSEQRADDKLQILTLTKENKALMSKLLEVEDESELLMDQIKMLTHEAESRREGLSVKDLKRASDLVVSVKLKLSKLSIPSAPYQEMNDDLNKLDSIVTKLISKNTKIGGNDEESL